MKNVSVIFLGKLVLNLEIEPENTVSQIVRFLDDHISKNYLKSTNENKIKIEESFTLSLKIDERNIVKNFHLRNEKYKDVKIFNNIKKESKFIYSRKTLEEVEEERELDNQEFIEEKLKHYREQEEKYKYHYNTQCVKVEELRKEGYENLKDWMSLKSNVYVGRAGRVFITEEEKYVFHYPKSKWGNPYSLKEGYTLSESIRLYHLYLLENDLLKDLHELKGKTLGCFCDQSHVCHAKELADLLNQV